MRVDACDVQEMKHRRSKEQKQIYERIIESTIDRRRETLMQAEQSGVIEQ